MTDKTYGRDKLTVGQMHSNKKDALTAGQSHYFTSKPCIHGHLSPRRTINTGCIGCEFIAYKKKYIPNPRRKMTKEEKAEKRKIYTRQYWKDNKDRLMPKIREYRLKNKNKIREQSRACYLRKTGQNHAGITHGVSEINKKKYGPGKLTIGQMHSNRKDARAAGHSHYFRNKSCKYGHVEPYTVSGGLCATCVLIHSKRRKERQRKERKKAPKFYGPEKLTIKQMLSNKKEAFDAGYSHYFTGKPCKWGHITPRIAKTGVCLECRKIYQQNYYSKTKKSRRILTEEKKRTETRILGKKVE